MAVQVYLEEMEGCRGYFDWIVGKVTGIDGFKSEAFRRDTPVGVGKGSDEEIGAGKSTGKGTGNGTGEHLGSGADGNFGNSCAKLGPLVDICSVMFDTDFIWDNGMKEDEIRATDAMELRRRYSEEEGLESGKSAHDIDRIWKSICGKCSVLELIVGMCFRMDEMVNEDEDGAMVGIFFGILVRNLGFDSSKDLNAEDGKEILRRFLQRKYSTDGSGGGLFPLKKWDPKSGGKDQREVPIWYQMNTWLNEHLDEDEHFIVPV